VVERAQANADAEGNLDGLVKAGRLTTTVAALIHIAAWDCPWCEIELLKTGVGVGVPL